MTPTGPLVTEINFRIDVANVSFIGRCETDATVIALAERNFELSSLDDCRGRISVIHLSLFSITPATLILSLHRPVLSWFTKPRKLRPLATNPRKWTDLQ
ncbi:MAG: hypothetical protein GY938_21540 [Ketobacter sp.]|nr:hypothetical protein [Ketobacter sp.]